MQWKGLRESSNVEDLRGGGGGRRMLVGGGLGSLVLGLLAYVFFGDTSGLTGGSSSGPGMANEQPAGTPQNDEGKQFVSVILAETEGVWNEQFRQLGSQYQEPQLVLFRGSVQSGCGGAEAAMGPFYCPADRKVYIDLSFFDDLSSRFGAGGDFARAYVIAHEVGHHVQNLMGTSDKVQAARQRANERESNRLSVMLELQADFYAGVWANHSKQLKIDAQDIEEALNAAQAIGDDRLQKEAQGYSVPESFTHGTSQQRMYWFKKGWETGDVRQGNTFDSGI